MTGGPEHGSESGEARDRIAFAADIGKVAARKTVIGPNGEEGPWDEFALCAQVDPKLFYPERGGSLKEAKQVCGRCSVRAECLEYALENNERFGIWGGLTEPERRRIKRP